MFSRLRFALRAFLLIVLAFSVSHTSSRAATLDVPSQYATIGAAVSAASSGDTIAIDPAQGPYSAAGDLNLILTKSLTFESSDSTTNAVIDCDGEDSFIEELNSDNLSLTFQNLTFKDTEETVFDFDDSSGDTFTFNACEFTSLSGLAAVTTVDANTVNITDCTMNDNSAQLFELELGTLTVSNSDFENDSNIVLGVNETVGTVSGCTFKHDGSSNGNGPIVWLNASLTMTDCTFTNNTSYGGGGAITIDSAGLDTPVTLDRCIFTGNSTVGNQYGGGVVLMFEGDHNIPLVMNDCVFLDNSSTVDGAVVGASTGIGGGSLTVTNCSFYGNSYTGGSASGQGVIASTSVTPLTIRNSIMYGDTTPNEISTNNPPSSQTVSNSDIHQSGYAGSNGNINSDPDYAAAASGDLHITNASPCVQAGTSTGAPATDFDQYAWGSTVSIGAYSPIHFAFSTPSTVTSGVSFPFTVTAVAADNSTTITNYGGTVHFTSSDGVASLPADSTLTNGTGNFNATLNTTGNQKLTAADKSTTAYTATSAGIAVIGAATRFVVSAPSSATAGDSVSVTVTAEDANGNTATQYSGTVHLASSDAQAVLPSDSTLSNGVGTFAVTLDTAGNQTVTATDTQTSTITGTSNTIDVTAAIITPTGGSLTGIEGQSTSGTLATFTSSDSNLGADAYVAVVNWGDGTQSAGTVAAGGGSGAFDVTGSHTYAEAGAYSIVVAITPIGGSPSDAEGSATISDAPLVPGAAVTINAHAGVALSSVLVATFADGNPLGALGDFSAAIDWGDGTPTTPGTVTQPGGTGTAFDISGDHTYTAVGEYTIHVTIADEGGSTATTTGTADVTAGPASTFVVSAPGTATAGAPFNFTVTAEDQFGNTVTAYSGTVHFTSSDGLASLPADTTLTDGVGTFSATLKSVGSRTITATDAETSSITGTTNAIAVGPGPAAYFAVIAPSTTITGSPLNFTVTAVDAYGNVATGYSGTVQFTSTDDAATLPPAAKLTNGTRTLPATLYTIGNHTITATDSVDQSITGTTSVIYVAAAAASYITISGPSSATAGTPVTFTVTARDRFGNTANAYAGTLHFTSSDPAAVLPPDATLKNGTGTFSATLKTTGTRTITATDTVTSSITGTTDPFTVSAGAATHLLITGPTSATFGSPSTFTVTAVDAFGNTVTNYTGTVHVTSNAPVQTTAPDSQLRNGTGQFAVTISSLGDFTVTATDNATPSITGSTSISVAGGNLHTFSAGLQMVSAPADYTGDTIAQIFTPAPTMFAAWNASTFSYAVAPNAPADTIHTGVGYWANLSQSTTLLDIGKHPDPTQPFTISLATGWNMIGDPFSTAADLTTGVTVTTNTIDAAPWFYATHNALIAPTLYTFPVGATNYVAETSTLQPYAGYWIYAYAPCTLSISAN